MRGAPRCSSTQNGYKSLIHFTSSLCFIVKRDKFSNNLQSTSSWRNPESGCGNHGKTIKTAVFIPSQTIVVEGETLGEKKLSLPLERSRLLNKPAVFEEDFAEVLLDDEWVKVEILTREGLSMG